MTLFKKVFGQQEAGVPVGALGDVPMETEAPRSADRVSMEDIENAFATPEPKEDIRTAPETHTPNEDAIAEAKSLLEAAQVTPVKAPESHNNAAVAKSSKTRILGFNPSLDNALDPIRAVENAEQPSGHKFPVGWLVIIKGQGVGAQFPIFAGVANIGRGGDQTVPLDFGDTSISRENHAALAFDPEQVKFYLGHGGKSNIVRLNNLPVLTTEEVNSGDTIRIGETTLRFVAFCDESFEWGETDDAS